MRIGIDARAAAEVPAGRGRYVRELLAALAELDAGHEYLLYARQRWGGVELDPRFEWRLIGSRDPVWHLRTARAASRECDVYLSTNSYLTAWLTRIPTVCVVFDMVAFDAALRPQRRAGLIERATLARAVRRSAGLLAISESTARDLAVRHPEAAAKTDVTPLAADAAFTPQRDGAGPGDAEVLARHGLVRPYVLAVGTLEPRKNLPRLIEAFAALPEALRERFELAVVGPGGWEIGETLSAAERNAGRVRTIGFVPDAELPALYRGAELFCYPSLYEGFGLPVLEAMSCGAAVVTSGVSSLPEVGGDAVAYCDPRDTADIRRTMVELLDDDELRADLGRRGAARSREFDWARTARATLDALERWSDQPGAGATGCDASTRS